MRITETSTIRRTAAEVWPFIVAPEAFRQWNTKIVSMEAKERFRHDQPFVTRYQMSGKQMQCISTVTALVENSVLEICHAHCVGNGISSDLEVTERITLEEAGGRTTVRKDVNILNHGMPWYIIPIVWLITRFGKPAGPDRLKQMCELAP